MQKQSIDSVVLELMASRICHDLISPVGAVNNGVEFLEDDMGGGNMGDAIELIAMSAQSAGARLQLFRLAYGAGGRDVSIKPEDIHKTFDAFLQTEGKIKQEWDPITTFAGYDRPEGLCKLLACTLLLMSEALPKGGMIRVAVDGAAVTVLGEGADAHIRPLVDKALARDIDLSEIDPRLVHPYITGVLAAQYGHNINIIPTDDGQACFKITPL